MASSLPALWQRFVEAANIEEIGRMLFASFEQNPLHVLLEVVLLVFIAVLFFQKSYKPNKKETLSKKEMDAIIKEWKPKPLAKDLTEEEQWMATPDAVLTGMPTAHCQVEGVQGDVINFAAMNFLGLVGHPRITEASVKTVEKYGCGSCGPRGFYGTIDVHLNLEAQLAKFMKTDEAILYASGFNTVASAIPAFLKRGDLIIADEGCYFSIQQGIELSRADVKWFKHNDIKHLEELLKEAVKDDAKRRAPLNRRFICVEGIYKNYGDLAPLKEIMALKEKYKFRLLMDESCSLGVLGKTGRGLCEQVDIPRTAVEVTTSALSNSFASVGGFCTGSHEVCDHQRLSGAAYCFSASVVPYLATAASEAITLLEEQPQLIESLRANSKLMFTKLATVPGIKVSGDALSPLAHIRLSDTTIPVAQRMKALQTISEILLHKRNILVSVSRYAPQERVVPEPSIRLCITAKHTAADVDKLTAALKQVVAEVVKGTPTIVELPESSKSAPTPAKSGKTGKKAEQAPVAEAPKPAEVKKETKKAEKKKADVVESKPVETKKTEAVVEAPKPVEVESKKKSKKEKKAAAQAEQVADEVQQPVEDDGFVVQTSRRRNRAQQ